MSDKITRQIPGNIPDGVIRNQQLDLSQLPQKIIANEFFECSLTGEASELYGELGPNLISCKLDNVTFPSGVSHFDAKDTLFLRSQIRYKFERIMATQCAFRDVTFSGATLKDTAFIDSVFEDVEFVDCDFSVATFKSDVFRDCSFVRCKSSNKLFEHCLFFHCHFASITLQEGSILQNYGIHLGDTVDLLIYSAETGEPLPIADLTPKNRLEKISLEYFYGLNLNESQDLLEVVQFKLDDATKTNILHMVTGIRQLTSFLLFLYSESRILLLFPLQLFWSIDQFLGSQENELPLKVLEALEISSARLRRVYEEICLSIPPSEDYRLLIREEYSKDDLRAIIEELGVDVEIRNFRPFNSPSLADIASPNTFELFLFITFILSTRFRAEVDHYQAQRKLLDIGTRLISDGKTNPTAAYQALVTLNVPKLIYIRLSARISLSLIGRLRRIVLRVLEDESAHPGDSIARENGRQLSPYITILYLAANPPETIRLRLDREVKEIDSALRASGAGERFRLAQTWAVGARELQDSLLRYEPDIVHLSSHGDFSGKPILEKEDFYRDLDTDSARAIENSDMEFIHGLTQLFSVASQRVRCVVLNACHSAKVAEAISVHVDCVIGMSTTISDDAAIRFSWAFYHSLAYGKSIRIAFDLAIVQLELAGYRQSQVPMLFPGRSDPNEVVLVHPRHRRS